MTTVTNMNSQYRFFHNTMQEREGKHVNIALTIYIAKSTKIGCDIKPFDSP